MPKSGDISETPGIYAATGPCEHRVLFMVQINERFPNCSICRQPVTWVLKLSGGSVPSSKKPPG